MQPLTAATIFLLHEYTTKVGRLTSIRSFPSHPPPSLYRPSPALHSTFFLSSIPTSSNYKGVYISCHFWTDLWNIILIIFCLVSRRPTSSLLFLSFTHRTYRCHYADKFITRFGASFRSSISTNYCSQLKGGTMVNTNSQAHQQDQATIKQCTSTLPLSDRNTLWSQCHMVALLFHVAQDR